MGVCDFPLMDKVCGAVDFATNPAGTVTDGLGAWIAKSAGELASSAADLAAKAVNKTTHDYDFTNKPTSSCSNKYDIRSVGTHEAGHVFGLGHVGSGHSNLTMYTNSFTCKTIARTLGKGDVLALRSIYEEEHNEPVGANHASVSRGSHDDAGCGLHIGEQQ